MGVLSEDGEEVGENLARIERRNITVGGEKT
jgi:hypothetical protein